MTFGAPMVVYAQNPVKLYDQLQVGLSSGSGTGSDSGSGFMLRKPVGLRPASGHAGSCLLVSICLPAGLKLQVTDRAVAMAVAPAGSRWASSLRSCMLRDSSCRL